MQTTVPTPWTLPPDWPAPTEPARAHSERLVEHIRAELAAAEGWISFSRYMELALYTPGLGYYSAGAHKFGAAGDFVTAPEISPLFGRAIARSCDSVLAPLGGGDILELGAGSGRLARDLLLALQAQDALPDRYRILEPSADLRQRQQALLAESLPDYFARIEWLDRPPQQPWRGLLLANEVVDALPVTLFGWSSAETVEYGVIWTGTAFAWQAVPAAAAVSELTRDYAGRYDWPAEYRSELNLGLGAWLRAVIDSLQAGAALFIDYGYTRHEYYHAQRAQGSLLCHYRHRAHSDALILPGIQDITASVDFTALAEAGAATGCTVEGYVTQAHYLLDAGIEQDLAALMQADQSEFLRSAAHAKTLLLPGEMGERFKCLLLGRDWSAPVVGFRGRDQRARL